MKNVINLISQPDSNPIQAIYLASSATTKTQEALERLGFTDLDNNVWAIIPEGATREECQARIKQHPRPLIPVEGDPIVSLEEGLAWLEE